MKYLFSKQFFKFLIAGTIAAIVNFFSRIFLNHWYNFSFSIFLAFLIGISTAFILTKFFVFKKSQQTVLKSLSFFIAINIFALLQTWGVALLLFYIILPYFEVKLMTQEISHAIGIITTIFSSYFCHQRWSFR